MPEPIASYAIRRHGLWAREYHVSNAAGPVGVLSVERSSRGVITGATYKPEKGEVLHLRRDPGLLRGQFSMWTANREWLGSSLRWSVFRREIALHTGNKPLRLAPLAGLATGWSLQAPKTGEMARIRGSIFSGPRQIEVFRKVEFELVVFAFFLGSLVWVESTWPGPEVEAEPESAPASKASAS